MNWLSKALHGLGVFIRDLFTSPDAQKRAEAALQTAGNIAKAIYPFVETIAAMTPTRTDDQILAVIKKFGLEGIVDPNQPDKASALHDIALNIARSLAPGISSSVLSLAIETAYQALKANSDGPSLTGQEGH